MKRFNSLALILALGALVLSGCGGPQPEKPKQDLAKLDAKKEDFGKLASKLDAGKFTTVYFDYDKYNIKPEFEDGLKASAELLKATKADVVLEGHCDERGSNEYNMALGHRRANSTKKALVELGANPKQIKTVSYGEERPVAAGHDESAWSQNRRSQIVPKDNLKK